MDFKSTFLNALSSPPKLSQDKKPEDFLGRIYPVNEDPDSPLFQVLSGGCITASSPFSYDIRSLDCFMLLYTKKGCGKLLIGNQVYTLAHPSLLLMDCHERFRLDIAIEPWEYDVLFLTGGNLSYYYNLLPEKKPVLLPVSPYSETALALERLMTFRRAESAFSALMVSSLVNFIITGCITHQLTISDPSPSFPAYLSEMKDLFDNSYNEDYSLDELEARFHISKYRLCREFGSNFGMPPLQYLNKRRIDVARHLLLTTTMKVHEIGSQVGIDNTNHFIFLFKKFTDMTPLEYRQRMTL